MLAIFTNLTLAILLVENHCFKTGTRIEMENSVQQTLFQHIKSKLPAHISLAEDVANILDISNDSAYRRLRGEKPITIDEVEKLCSHYHISFDQLMNINSNSIVFTGNNVIPGQFDFELYLRSMLESFKMIQAAGQKKMYYEAKDMPIFYLFQFNELASFKFFFWMKTVLSYPQYAKVQYEDNELGDVLLKWGKGIIQAYDAIPSVEIWTEESINATLHQLEYYTYTGVFKKKENIELLYAQFEQVIDHVKEQAEAGEKYLIGDKPMGIAGNYQLYFNEVFLGHNSIMVETDGMLTTFLNHGTLNYITTRDKNFCDYTKAAIDNTIKKSLLISSVSEKERNRFFNILKDKISKSKEKTLA